MSAGHVENIEIIKPQIFSRRVYNNVTSGLQILLLCRASRRGDGGCAGGDGGENREPRASTRGEL